MAAQRRRFRWWLGLLVGAGIGVTLWQADAAFNGIGTPSLVRGLSVRQFAMLAQNGNGSAGDVHLEDVRVHPPLDGKHVVTARLVGNGQNSAVEFDAPMPLVVPPVSRDAATTQPATYASIFAFLDRSAPNLSYRYAWWERPDLRADVFIGTPAIALGVLLPAAIWGLRRAGLIAPLPEPEPEPELPSPPDLTPTPIAVRPIVPPPDEPVLAAAPGEPTTYEGGVYYPVHIPKAGEHEPPPRS